MKDLTSISSLLAGFTKESSLNIVQELDNLQIFDEPLVGFASAEDPLFTELKKDTVIGAHHLTPKEWLPEAVSVVSYFLPFTLQVRKSNRTKDGLPSTEWLYGRVEGEAFNNAVRRFLAEKLIEAGCKAIVPCIDDRYKSKGYSSNWSERHVAYISGLGTFNLSKSIITEKGCAGRFGSIIIDKPLEYTKRPYTDLYEYCNNCGACIRRCPVQAISKSGKEHLPCGKFLNEITMKRFAPRYGCGKCQTSVPCEARIPIVKN
jgi:epoxyqueuosine reductase